ncbi:hypothetical protein LSAT2_009134 [Lamellibrachia satsuma]|nr:hypothetical protein LSAT2_009134 [Lamellibrachia satsuma]
MTSCFNGPVGRRRAFFLLLLLLLVTALLMRVVEKNRTPPKPNEMDEYVYSFGRGNEPLQQGRALRVNRSLIQSLGLPPRRFARLSESTLNDFVAVTAASASHFIETYDAVASIQNHLPWKTIFFYDLGLNKNQVAKLKTWCNVTYRKFDFNKFPPHVSALRTYAWKPLIIQELFRVYDTVLWMDSSFRLFKPHLKPAVSRIMKSGYGVVLFSSGGGPNFSRTHREVYEFLPTDRQRQKRTGMGGATAMLLCNTRRTYTDVLRWLYLCALEERCIAPTRNTTCGEKISDEVEYRGCHRFDQSVINVLVSNVMDFTPSKYTTVRREKFFICIRHPTEMYKLHVCDKTKSSRTSRSL